MQVFNKKQQTGQDLLKHETKRTVIIIPRLFTYISNLYLKVVTLQIIYYLSIIYSVSDEVVSQKYNK